MKADLSVIALALILATTAGAQIATLPGSALDLELRGGQHFGASVGAQYERIALSGRSLGSAWDAGATGRAGQLKFYNSSGASWLDFGGTVRHGSAGTKGAIELGWMSGESAELIVWVRGGIGNYRYASAGTTIGRVSLSGTYGNYWENRCDARIRLWRRISLTAGYSNVLGPNAGLVWRWPAY